MVLFVHTESLGRFPVPGFRSGPLGDGPEGSIPVGDGDGVPSTPLLRVTGPYGVVSRPSRTTPSVYLECFYVVRINVNLTAISCYVKMTFIPGTL